MKTARTIRVVACVVLLACTIAGAGYLESDFPTGKQQPAPAPRPPVVVNPPVVPPRPVPVVDNPATRLVSSVQVGQPIRWGSLVLFPVTMAGPEPVARIHSLGTAVDRGWVTIEESKPATVSRANLVNSSDNLVLVLAGELIKGGQQNRSSQKDLLLLGRSTAAIDLYCVEQHRWSGEAKFDAARQLAPQSVRSGNVAGADQARVWADVKSFNESAGATDRGESLLAGLDSAKVQRELAECRRVIVPQLPRECVGLIAGRNGRIFAADLFVDPDLFAAYRPMLIDSYAGQEILHKLRPQPRPEPVEPMEDSAPGRGRIIRPVTLPVPDRAAAAAFIHAALRAQFDALVTPGGGSLWRITGSSTGQAIDYRGQAVHVALTEQIVPMASPRPVPPPRPVPIPMPRQGE